FAECGATVRGELEQTDTQVREILAGVPEDRRTLVTDHDAYGYFSEAYDFTVSGVVVPGGSTDGEPSSQEIAELARSIRDGGADAVITSVGARNSLVDTVAEEAGDLPVIEVYEGGVGPKDTPEADYAEAMLLNARTLADALEG
ncbi:MAG TPA: zinc ABC transporter substrate-binding protein, partial [Micrococcus luteus]|nr:zinc ABC transporter substrate-binding protein [Micrococcus luteus]